MSLLYFFFFFAMSIPIVSVISSTIILQTNYVPVVKTVLQFRTPPMPSTALYQIKSLDENHDNSRGLDQSPRIKSLNQDIWSSARYPTLSPSTYGDDNGLLSEKLGKSPKNIGQIGIYSQLTTAAHSSCSFPITTMPESTRSMRRHSTGTNTISFKRSISVKISISLYRHSIRKIFFRFIEQNQYCIKNIKMFQTLYILY